MKGTIEYKNIDTTVGQIESEPEIIRAVAATGSSQLAAGHTARGESAVTWLYV